ncbi:Diphthamide biosynthesis protein 2 [Smittium culicis]|uniref:S-adenosyl-L-methionine:L-histidine 3-amino-3-carboxypropyltransferase 2 n=1 Tax=Smittium culicis TaxID=133412 RepID=A0A1R1YIQ0_9FUNG|nr:Diphthamide biosynthesis protein 2 [Smittium culicis]
MDAISPVNIDNDGSSVIQKTLLYSKDEKTTDLSSLNQKYELDQTCDLIISRNYSNIALQFPDNLLLDSAAVFSEIRNRTAKNVYILGDTTFGSCCVDEVAASHVNADLIVHYGNTCLSHTSRIPVLYVYSNHYIDIQDAASKISTNIDSINPSQVLLLFDQFYRHSQVDLVSIINKSCKSKVLSPSKNDTDIFFDPKVSTNSQSDSLLSLDGFSFSNNIDADTGDSSKADPIIIYVGHEGPKFFLVQKARDAKIVGLVVGTLSARVLPACRHASRNAPCPSTRFERLFRILHRIQQLFKQIKTDLESDIPHYSLVTGKLVSNIKLETYENSDGGHDDSNMQVSVKDANNKVALKMGSSSFIHMSNRSFQGLHIDVEDKTPSMLTDGRSGIAKGYSNEK